MYLQIITNNFSKPISGQSSIFTSPENTSGFMISSVGTEMQYCLEKG